MLFDPIWDYLVHGISALRTVLRIVAGVLFAVGGWVFLNVRPPLHYLAVPLLVVASLWALYDLATVTRHTR